MSCCRTFYLKLKAHLLSPKSNLGLSPLLKDTKEFHASSLVGFESTTKQFPAWSFSIMLYTTSFLLQYSAYFYETGFSTSQNGRYCTWCYLLGMHGIMKSGHYIPEWSHVVRGEAALTLTVIKSPENSNICTPPTVTASLCCLFDYYEDNLQGSTLRIFSIGQVEPVVQNCTCPTPKK